MTLWIIIGALVALVAIFLVVMSIKDRKKAKALQVQKKAHDKARNESRKNVILFLDLLIAKNTKLVKEFVPSVGKLKMGDIRSKAKKTLEDFKKTREYKFASEAELNKELIILYKNMEQTNSNIWDKKFELELKELKDAAKKLPKEFVNNYKADAEAIIKDGYK